MRAPVGQTATQAPQKVHSDFSSGVSFNVDGLAFNLNKAHRDMILGHILEGMDIHSLVSTEESLKATMDKYIEWLDDQFEAVSRNVDKKDNIES